MERRSGCLNTLIVWGLVGGLGAYIGGEPRLRNFIDNKLIPYFSQTVIPETKKLVGGAKERVIERAGVEGKVNNGFSGFLDDLGFSKMTAPGDPMYHSDGTKVEPWQYNGFSWPNEWPITNADGSYNQDYLRWYSRQHRK